MRTIRTEIEIEASTNQVWKILMDHEEYPNWNPFIKKVEGSTVPGEYLTATIQADGKSPMTFKPEVLTNEKNREFRWVGKLFVKGIADGEHYFQLEELSDNKVRLVHGENFTGILSGVLMKMMGESTKEGFNAMNHALKLKAEMKQ